MFLSFTILFVFYVESREGNGSSNTSSSDPNHSQIITDVCNVNSDSDEQEGNVNSGNSKILVSIQNG